jgi:DnaJ homolog subfamily C member 28
MADDLSMSPVERAIQRAIAEGLFDNLPGTGKPLNWRAHEESHTPREMRMANKIMKDHDVAPSWMMLGQALNDREGKITAELKRGLKAYQGALQDAERRGDLGRRQRVMQAWERLLATFEEAAARYNRNVLTYNVMIPPGLDRREFINIERELEKLTRR